MEPRFPPIYYGGDYNPDQWPEAVWSEDMRLFGKAGINILTVPVFSWAKLQPEEDKYAFEWLDKVLDMAHDNGMAVCLATSTAAQPAWMSRKYPEILPVDFEGRKRKHGGRVNFCPNSRVFRHFSGKLAGKLAERYKNHPALAFWHIGNEYGNYCYCDTCEKAFREWLRGRYGTLEELNRCWNMSFWGHTVYDWEEIMAPSGLCEMWMDGSRERTTFQGMALDYKRFMSESVLNCFLNELEAIRRECPHVPVTTNFMGSPFKPLDYFKWAEHLDVISWDNYPALTAQAGSIAFNHDLMRGLKNGQPFMLMEQTPSQTNWQPYNSLKRPGVMRLLSYQALARGSDTVMFFQLRRSVGACEKFHSAVIDHAGHENTRVYRECAQLGEELKKLSCLTGSRVKAKAAILFDWENWWAVELSSGPNIQLQYADQVMKYHKPFYDRNIPVDLVRPDGDLSGYSLVIAPVLYMVKKGVADHLESFVNRGGTLVATFFSGMVDESDLVTLGGYPGQLRKLLGIWVEEIDALEPSMRNTIVMKDQQDVLRGIYECGMICDVLHAETARVLAEYGRDFYAGTPVLTVNDFGSGKAYYVATDAEQMFVDDFLAVLARDAGVNPPFECQQGVEITRRFRDDKVYTFVLNHNDHVASADLTGLSGTNLLTGAPVCGILSLAAKDVIIVESQHGSSITITECDYEKPNR